MRTLFLTIAAALMMTGAAQAYTISDLQADGYTVSVSNPGPVGCGPVYYVSGHGVGNYFQACTADGQAMIDSLANPSTIYESDWQANHPDQYAAASKIGGLCYSITRSAPTTDSWLIVGGATNLATPGAGLVQLSNSLQNICGGNTPPATVLIAPSTDGTTNSAPGAAAAVAAITTQAQTQGTPQTTLDAGGNPVAVIPVVSLSSNVVAAITGSTITGARSTPAGGATPLLTAALRKASGKPVTVTKLTVCRVSGKVTPCSHVFSILKGKTVHLALAGSSVTRLNIA